MEFGFLSPAYNLLKDIFGWFRPRKSKLSNEDIMRLRNKWKREIEDRLVIRRRDKLRMDVIIRDLKRMDSYPDVDEKAKGISPWFRAGLVGTYHKGVQIGLGWEGLIINKDGTYRQQDYKSEKEVDITAMLIGYVPYEHIESIDWEGDEYYGFPHIYCHFDAKKGEPYQRLAYCEKRNLVDFEYYSDLVAYDAVAKRKRK